MSCYCVIMNIPPNKPCPLKECDEDEYNNKEEEDCSHENITVDEIYGEQFCEDCNSFVDRIMRN